MSCEQHLDAIDELVDGTLSPSARAGVEAHLAECESCAALLTSLRRIKDTAGSLNRMAPPPGAFRAIESRLQAEGLIARTQRPPMWQMLAAAAALLLVTGGSTIFYWLRTTEPTQPSQSAGAGLPAPAGAALSPGDAESSTAESIEEELRLAEEHYTKAIAGLEQVAKAQEQELDPEIAATLRMNLEIIDQAISQSRAALSSAPGNLPARASLFEALRSKVALLQDAIVLMNEMRQDTQSAMDGAKKS